MINPIANLIMNNITGHDSFNKTAINTKNNGIAISGRNIMSIIPNIIKIIFQITFKTVIIFYF